MKELSEYIELGGCSKPHGIKGAFAFHLYNTEDSVLTKGSKVLLYPKDGSKVSKEGEEHEIASIAFGNKIIVTLKEVKDRNKVEEMIPFSIHFKKSDLPEPEEGEFYLEDLIGLKVISEATGEEVGRVSSHYDNSAQIVLVIRGKQNFEVPFIDNFVKEIDLEAGTVQIVVPEMIG
ncbi:MAG: 16S rRNA processing protein RimM [Halobacteriovorax sp.]|nr:16S rRNA processing protein RimM [Halobacteriovorax sp.]|tara:strand:- start:112698 stop:113225 length:528 start_codon:yes stop_codon:yes gene_type:complete